MAVPARILELHEDATLVAPVHLCGDLWQVAGPWLTHPFDAAAYLIAGEMPVLVDCGSGRGHERLVAHLDALGVVPSDLHLVLATHGHFDHLAGLDALRRDGAPDLPLALHTAEHEAVRDGDGLRTAAALLYDAVFPPLRVDHDLRDGEVLRLGGARVDVVHTPGHSPGSTSFVVHTGGRRILLAGDALWGGFHPAIDSDLTAWHATMERLRGLDVDAMSFGHGVHHLVEDAGPKIADAASQLGWMFNPWHRRPAAR